MRRFLEPFAVREGPAALSSHGPASLHLPGTGGASRRLLAKAGTLTCVAGVRAAFRVPCPVPGACAEDMGMCRHVHSGSVTLWVRLVGTHCAHDGKVLMLSG